MIEIRAAKEQDMEAVLSIYNYEVMHGTATFDVVPRTMEELMDWFRRHVGGRHPVLVAGEDGRVGGFASLSAYRDRAAYDATAELSMYVDAAYRRRGIARALLQALFAGARERGHIRTVISVIGGENTASLALHREFGFREVGTFHEVGEKFGQLLDTHLMQLML